MHSDYDKIRENNIRDYGVKTSHLKLLGEKLYTEKTHFIFELLQNAEDEGATEIQFNLLPDRLEVLHNGKPFSEADVKGICGFGDGPKEGDFTKIGKIGIGFKSVYVFTNSPEIHSDDEHFKIEHYVRPFLIKKKNIPKPWTTLIILPFNRNDEMNSETCCQLIGKGLRELKLRSILFLRNIKNLKFCLLDDENGNYSRIETPNQHSRTVRLNGRINQTTLKNEKWLVFDRKINLSDDDNKKSKVFVEIAFKNDIVKIDDNMKNIIIKDEDTPLTVFFPTELETKFGFLLQGPYVTNSSRNSIPYDDEWNIKLIKETALLFNDVLPQIRDMNLMTMSFFESLPIKPENFNKDNIFYPISQAILEIFRNKELLPTSDGKTFVSAQNAKIARGIDLRKLINDTMLNDLFNTKSLKWLSDSFPQNPENNIYKYITGDNFLKIEPIEAEDFCRKAVNSKFFEKYTDNIEWFKELYIFISARESLWRKGHGYLRDKPFILLEDNSIKPLFQNINDETALIYLPLDNTPALKSVKKALLEDDKGNEVKTFFKEKLKIMEWKDIADVITNIIPKYQHNLKDISFDEHFKDIKKIFNVFIKGTEEERKNLLLLLKEICFILTENIHGKIIGFKKPNEVYYKNLDLEIYFAFNEEVGFVSKNYDELYCNFLKILNVNDQIRIKKSESDYRNYVNLPGKRGFRYRRGINNYDPDIRIEDLRQNLLIFNNDHTISEKEKMVSFSRYLWNNIAIKYFYCIKGKIEKSTNQNYINSFFYDDISEFGMLLINTAWLPNKNNDFFKPSELKFSELPEGFQENENLIRKLGMKKDLIALLAAKIDIPEEDIIFMQNNHDAFKRWKEDEERKQMATASFPDKVTKNPELRKKRVKEIAKEEVDRIKVTRQVTIPVTGDEGIRAKKYLEDNYKDENNIMRCQMCGTDYNTRESPFEYDGIWHFEAYRFLPSPRNKLHTQNKLALCHNHAAMFAFASIEERERIENDILNINTEDERSVEINLVGKTMKIWFTQDHINDLKDILEQNKEGTSE